MKTLRSCAAGMVALLALSGCSSSSDQGSSSATPGGQSGSTAAAPTASPTPQPKEYPMGGRQLFPTYRLMGYSGIIGSGPGLGRAGVGDIDDRMKEIQERGKPYEADGRKVMPTLEFIGTMVHPCDEAPKCRTRASDEEVQKHLAAVRKVHGMLLIAIQPGRSDFPTEVKAYEKFLKEPDVGVALDPEWRMGPDQEPMKGGFGSVDSAELNKTAEYLSTLTKANDLPEKVMLYHMIRPNWVRQPERMKQYPGVATITSVDGIGDPKLKTETWQAIMKVRPGFAHAGFKLFYDEDTKRGQRLMTPAEVLGLKPTPEYVLYE